MRHPLHILVPGLLAFLLVSTGCQPAADVPTTVALKGTVKSATGEVPVQSHVQLADMSDRANTIPVDVDADGAFAVDVPVDSIYRLDVAAVGHEKLQLPLLLDGETELRVDVALEPTPFHETFEEVEVRGDWGEDGADATAPMEPRDDGTFVFVAEGLGEKERVRYQLVGAAATGFRTHGTHADAYEYDDRAGFYSLVDVVDGRVEITFDPSTLPAAAEGPRVTSSSAAVEGVLELLEVADRAFVEYLRQSMAAKAAKEAGEESGRADWFVVNADLRAALLAVVDDASAPAVLRSYAAIRFMEESMLQVTEDEKVRLLEKLPASSPLWAMGPGLAAELDPEADAELVAALREHPSDLVRGSALAGQVKHAKRLGDEAEWRRLFQELSDEFGDVKSLKRYFDQLDPDKHIRVGNPVPEFRIALLDAEGEVSNESLKGNYVLIDFWATWCAPCVAELPTIEKAWEKHKGSNFQVLSLSFDEAPGDIAPFRKQKYPMDWMHAFVEEGFENEVAVAFEVKNIPEPILIDPEGMIIATAEALRGELLLATLERHLGGEGEASSGP